MALPQNNLNANMYINYPIYKAPCVRPYVRPFVSLIFLEPKKVGSGCVSISLAALIFTAVAVLIIVGRIDE
jgi:hypothetical protein